MASAATLTTVPLEDDTMTGIGLTSVLQGGGDCVVKPTSLGAEN